MGELDLEQRDVLWAAKTHGEILMMIEEIKAFEERFKELDLAESEVSEEGLIEFKPVFLEYPEFEPVEPGEEVVKPGFGGWRRTILGFRKKRGLESGEEPLVSGIEPGKIEEKIIQGTVFRVRFDEGGNLVNVDIRKSKPRKTRDKAKKLGLKKLRFRRKGKTEEKGEVEKEEEKVGSRFSKLKGGIGKIKKVGKIKDVIPRRGRKEEEVKGEAEAPKEEKTVD